MSALDPASARAWLFGLTLHGVKLGLDNIRELLRADGDPQAAYPSVHVAGTNGKGSVLAFLQAMLREAGYRVGRFTSPHLLDVAERFQINGANIPERALADCIARFQSHAECLPHPPTFFEVTTAVAFRHFADAAVDLALVETGLGGRLDATNVLAPEICAITNIGLEHTAYLGDTLEAIAGEKAGILKPRTPLVTGETRPGPLGVILARAAGLDCPVRRIGVDFRHDLSGGPWDQRIDYHGAGISLRDAPLGLAGAHQGENAAVALALAESLAPRFPKLDRDAMARGLATAVWPGRLERVLDDPPVVLDVAHNPDGMRRLAAALDAAVVVLAVSSDKDAAAMIAAIRPVARALILTAYDGPRALPAADLAAAAGPHPHLRVDTLPQALELALSHPQSGAPLVVTGSIFAVAEARAWLIARRGAPPPRF